MTSSRLTTHEFSMRVASLQISTCCIYKILYVESKKHCQFFFHKASLFVWSPDKTRGDLSHRAVCIKARYNSDSWTSSEPLRQLFAELVGVSDGSKTVAKAKQNIWQICTRAILSIQGWLLVTSSETIR